MKRSCHGHTKQRKLMLYLNVRSYVAVGILESLWALTAREAPRGDIGKLANEDIAIGIDYDRDPDALVKALVKAGWLDEHSTHRLVIHDWHEHADDAVKKYISRNKLTWATLEPTCPDMSRHVQTNPDMSRPPEPEARSQKPEPMPEPAASEPVPEETAAAVVSHQSTAEALREYFPDTSDEFVGRLAAAAAKADPNVTDAEMAEAVRATCKRDQKSAGLWLSTVPTYLQTMRRRRLTIVQHQRPPGPVCERCGGGGILHHNGVRPATIGDVKAALNAGKIELCECADGANWREMIQ
jgi:hypothetical protein